MNSLAGDQNYQKVQKVARFPYSILYMHNATEVDSPSDVLHLHKVAFYI